MKKIIIFILAVWLGFAAGVLTAADFSKELCFLALVLSVWLFVVIGSAMALEKEADDDLKNSKQQEAGV